MISEIVFPKAEKITVKIPDEYIARRIKIIIFPVDEADSGFTAENHELTAFTEHSITNISDWQNEEEDTIWI